MAKTPAPDDNTDDNKPAPTEQLPIEAPPVRASNAASRGRTGLGSDPKAAPTAATSQASSEPAPDAGKRPSVFRHHPLATAIVAGVAAVIVVSGLTAWGVGAAVTASLTSSAGSGMSMGMPTPTPTSAPTTGPAAGKASTAGRLAFRATIQSIGGDSWTILTKKGKTVTVAVDSSTQFGTKRMSQTVSNFTVGESVLVVATRGTDGKPLATRIATPPAGNGGDSSADSSGESGGDSGDATMGS